MHQLDFNKEILIRIILGSLVTSLWWCESVNLPLNYLLQQLLFKHWCCQLQKPKINTALLLMRKKMGEQIEGPAWFQSFNISSPSTRDNLLCCLHLKYSSLVDTVILCSEVRLTDAVNSSSSSQQMAATTCYKNMSNSNSRSHAGTAQLGLWCSILTFGTAVLHLNFSTLCM